MKKGLTQTLLTVAIALLGYQALAMAPVISDIPSPVIGNAHDATSPNQYVWPDAIPLDNYVTPQTTGSTKADIKWYYQVESPGHYMLNGVAPLTAQEGAATDATTFPSAKRIDNQVLQNERNDDGVAKTVTIRNNFLSPLGGGQGGSLTGSGAIDSEVVTLYAADGTAYATKPVMFYTELGGDDHLYSAPFKTCTFATPEGWSFSTITNGVTSATSNNTALCFNVTQGGNAYGEWKSPMGLFTVEQNAVYKIRANLNSSYTTGGKTPFWDLYVNNYDGTKGLNLFGADLLILNNSANYADAVISSANGQDFQLWFTPMCVGTTQWSSNYAAANTGDNLKVFVSFRALDVRSDLGTAVTPGQTCLNELDITRYPISAATQVGTTHLYSRNNDFAPNTGANGNTWYDHPWDDTTISWTGGAITLTPTSTTSRGVAFITLKPATDTNYHLGQNDIGDDFPVAWDSDTLYRVTYDLMAPSAAAEANPFDAIYIGVDTPSNEVLMETFVTNMGTNKLAMPKYNNGTAQTYQAFWYSHKVSAATTPFYNHFRPRLTLVNNGGLTVGDNSGGLKVTKCTVDKVTFQ